MKKIKTLLTTLAGGLVTLNLVVFLAKLIQKKEENEVKDMDKAENSDIFEDLTPDVENVTDELDKVNDDIKKQKMVLKFKKGLLNSLGQSREDLSNLRKLLESLYEVSLQLDAALKRKSELETMIQNTDDFESSKNEKT